MKNQKGFTLIELLIVIAIIGVLVGVLLIGIKPLEQVRKARDTGLLERCKEVIGAAERYYAFHSADPSSVTCSSYVGTELKSGFDCTGLTLSGSGGNYTCKFTPASQAYKTKCNITATKTQCIVPTDF